MISQRVESYISIVKQRLKDPKPSSVVSQSVSGGKVHNNLGGCELLCFKKRIEGCELLCFKKRLELTNAKEKNTS